MWVEEQEVLSPGQWLNGRNNRDEIKNDAFRKVIGDVLIYMSGALQNLEMLTCSLLVSTSWIHQDTKMGSLIN